MLRFALEVIAANEPVVRAYRKAGFEITRKLSCLVLERRPLASPPPAGLRILPASREIVGQLASEMDWTPSFENRIAGMLAFLAGVGFRQPIDPYERARSI